MIQHRSRPGPRARPWLAPLALALVLAGCGRESQESLQARGKAELDKGNATAAVLYLKSALQSGADGPELRFLLGRALLDSGDPVSAAVELGKSLDQNHPHDQVLPKLARAMLLAGQTKRLVAAYGQVDLGEPQAQAALKCYLAEAYASLDDRKGTEASIAAALKAVPEHPQALILKARLLAGGGDFEGATRIADAVLARDPRRHEAWLLKGEILWFTRKDIPAAEAALVKSLEIEKAYVPAHSALISIRLTADDKPGARARADALRAVLPNHPQTLYVDALLAALDRDFKTAREKVQLVQRVLPDHTKVIQLAAAIEAELGQLVVAESLYAKAIKLDPTLGPARRSLAQAQLRLNRPARAWETLQPMVGSDADDPQALGLAGEAALLLGDLRAAETMFSRASRLEPDGVRARTSLAMTRLARGDALEALGSLRQLAASSKDNYADLALISAHLKRAEYPQALAAVDALARKQPDTALAFEMRGRVLASMGDTAGARSAFEAALGKDPGALAAIQSLNELDLREGRQAQALARIDKAVAAQPDSAALHAALAQVRERAGAPFEEVRRALNEAVRLAPTDPAIRVLLVDASLRAKQYKDALVAAQAADAAVPNDGDVLDALGRTQALVGDTQQAIGTFRRITNLEGSSPRPHLRLAALHRDQGNIGAATASLRRAIEIDPGQQQARTDLIDLLVRNNQPKQALIISRELQTRAPDQDTGYLLEGATQVRLKDLEAAIAVYRAGLQKVPRSEELARQLYRTLVLAQRDREADALGQNWIKAHPDDAAMHFEISSTALGRRQLELAERHLRLALAGRPDHPIALNNLAWVLSVRGKPGALPLAQRAVELLPNNPALLDTLAGALAGDNQIAQALATQKKAVEIAPGDTGLRMNLARLAIKANDKALARTELERLAALGTKFPLHEEVARLLKAI